MSIPDLSFSQGKECTIHEIKMNENNGKASQIIEVNDVDGKVSELKITVYGIKNKQEAEAKILHNLSKILQIAYKKDAIFSHKAINLPMDTGIINVKLVKTSRQTQKVRDVSFIKSHLSKTLPSLSNSEDKENLTPVQLAALFGDQKKMAVLIADQADLEVADDNEQTPLHLAVKNGYVEIVEMLIRADCRIDPQDSQGRTPFHLAILGGNEEIIELLDRVHCKINVQDHLGQTPLHLAVKYQPSLVDFLLDADADVLIPDDAGHTPLEHAVSNRNLEVIKNLCLTQIGDDPRNSRASIEILEIFYRSKHLSINEKKQILAAIREKYPEFDSFAFDEIEIRGLMAHSWGLKGNYTVQNLLRSYEGLYPDLTISYFKGLAKDFLDVERGAFLKDNFISKDPSIEKHLLHTLEGLIAAQSPHFKSERNLLNEWKSGKTIVLSTGWHEHETAVVLMGKYLVKCNRGARDPTKNSTIEVFELSESISDEQLMGAFSKLRENDSKLNSKEHRKYFLEGINKHLNLKK